LLAPRYVASRSLLYVAALPSAWFGVTYLGHAFAGNGWAAAYHERLAGVAYAALPPPLATLYATLVGVIGSLFLAIGIGQVVLATGLGRSHRPDTGWWALAALNVVGLGGLILVNLRNGLASPWWMNSIVLGVVLTGLLLARHPVEVPSCAP